MKELDDDISREFYDLILNTFREHGYKRYEVSNFARLGYESKHNTNYWKNKHFVGIGLGATGYEGDVIYKYIGNLNDFCEGKRTSEKDIVDKTILYENYILNNLRLEEGFSRREFKKIFQYDTYKEKKENIDRLVSYGLLVLTKDTLKCTVEGLILLDQVLVRLL